MWIHKATGQTVKLLSQDSSVTYCPADDETLTLEATCHDFFSAFEPYTPAVDEAATLAANMEAARVELEAAEMRAGQGDDTASASADDAAPAVNGEGDAIEARQARRHK